jgi:hypothetical protein
MLRVPTSDGDERPNKRQLCHFSRGHDTSAPHDKDEDVEYMDEDIEECEDEDPQCDDEVAVMPSTGTGYAYF